MTKECMVFPFKVRLYPKEITGTASWNDFVTHYAAMIETYEYRGRLIENLEDLVKQLQEGNVDRTGPEHYKTVGEDINKKSDTVEKLIAATIAAEGRGGE